MEPRGEIFLWPTKGGRKEMANAEQKSSYLWRCEIEGIKDGIWWQRYNGLKKPKEWDDGET
jgi:hypothetical protein